MEGTTLSILRGSCRPSETSLHMRRETSSPSDKREATLAPALWASLELNARDRRAAASRGLHLTTRQRATGHINHELGAIRRKWRTWARPQEDQATFQTQGRFWQKAWRETVSAETNRQAAYRQTQRHDDLEAGRSLPALDLSSGRSLTFFCCPQPPPLGLMTILASKSPNQVSSGLATHWSHPGTSRKRCRPWDPSPRDKYWPGWGVGTGGFGSF